MVCFGHVKPPINHLILKYIFSLVTQKKLIASSLVDIREFYSWLEKILTSYDTNKAYKNNTPMYLDDF